MPLDKTLRKVMVIGSGPIVIGQGAEFDYAGTQACRCLKEAGIEVVLINSNPATIMTDSKSADHIYIEPLTISTIKRIIEKERPNGLLSTLGGQTALTLSMELAKQGFLDKYGVRLLGANPLTIDKSEDRHLFKQSMIEIGEPVITSVVANHPQEALDFAREEGYPVIVRPAFTLGGTGGGAADNDEKLKTIAQGGLRMSPINQILIEKSVAGWKEIEFEVIRDKAGNVITVCSMENMDPVGVHTGDSIVIAPCVTLSDKEYQMLRTASINIVSALGVEGGCNCQFALNPNSFEYAVIEVNPRVSRSSALASKATGYPIAKIATKIAIGYNLDEILNDITGKSYAAFEPTLDYVVVKFPRWPFDKFVYANRDLGTQMKATGEVMAIGVSFEEALMKAVRGLEISCDSLNNAALKDLSDEKILSMLDDIDDRRVFAIFEALKRKIAAPKDISKMTGIDRWFISKLANLATFEGRLEKSSLYSDDDFKELCAEAKKLGYPDAVIESLACRKLDAPNYSSYKMVDTCAGEFAAQTPYFYGTHSKFNEAEEFLEQTKDPDRKTIIVLGSGPIRIGQGIEFDYASVHCVKTLKGMGYDVVIINNNPETVSTDFDTANRLYFEPITPEDVMSVIATEQPIGVVAAFGGQTAIKLAGYLDAAGINIIGTPYSAIDTAEDRERFDALLESLDIKRPKGKTVLDKPAALRAANELGYPVLLRPSYVLGGQNMIIAGDDADITEYMDLLSEEGDIENPVLIDSYLMGKELEVDAICDGDDILIPGIMEHIERAGVHSGDSIAVYPAWSLSEAMTAKILENSRKIALGLGLLGIVNIQYLVYENELYVIEVNPRSSRTVPYLSKVTGVPMVELAVRAMMGEKLSSMGYGSGIFPKASLVSAKVPVFSFPKLQDADSQLGPEMKSTGEVLGIAPTMEEALYKGFLAAGYAMKKSGSVLITLKDMDKEEGVSIGRKFHEMGFTLYATEGTAGALLKGGVGAHVVHKISEGAENALALIERGELSYVISTSSKGRVPAKEGVRIRRKAIEHNIPCVTSIDTAKALLLTLSGPYSQHNMSIIDMNNR